MSTAGHADGHAIACACGARRALARGAPDSVTWCHCDDCRRESGAPAFAWVGWREAAVEPVVGGGLGDLALRGTRPGVTRGRCTGCGATLAYRDRGLPGVVYVPLGAHDPIDDLVPTEHAYWPERPAWLVVADGLPTRDTTTQERVAAGER